MPQLGVLTRLDLRSVWPHEAHDFTPWLAEHIDDLAAALGLELELVGSEAAVGAFSLDLLARDLGRDRPVVIENQFGITDHDHLGKTLTYAAGHDAGAVIWVCENLREEHRQALEWLNQRTGSDTEFYGVIVEILQIDDSKPAFQFRPVVVPNEWQKRQRQQGGSSQPTERGEAYRAYFQGLIDRLREDHKFTNARVAQPQHWYSFGAGFSGVSYGAVFNKGDRVRTELYIGMSDADLNEQLFDHLSSARVAIEAELGTGLEWERLEEKKACRIAVYREGSIDEDSETLEAIRQWHVNWLLEFRQCFDHHLRAFRKGLQPA